MAEGYEKMKTELQLNWQLSSNESMMSRICGMEVTLLGQVSATASTHLLNSSSDLEI